MSAFLFCYVLFPLMLHRLQKMSSSHLLIVALGCYIVPLLVVGGAWASVTTLGGLSTLFWLLHPTVFMRLPQFVIGVVAALLSQRPNIVVRHPSLVAEACSAVLAFDLFACYTLTAGLVESYFAWMLFAQYLTPTVHAVWLAALSHPECRGPTHSVLCAPPMQALGAVSACVYLLHWPTLVVGLWFFHRLPPAGHTNSEIFDVGHGRWYNITPLQTTAVSLATLFVSALAHTFIEKPARNALNARWKDRAGEKKD